MLALRSSALVHGAMHHGLALALGIACARCAHTPRQPNSELLSVDDDRQPFAPRPRAQFSGLLWDGADQLFFRPFARVFSVPLASEAVNVNALDEVPDSSWFRNRIGPVGMPPDTVARGPCDAPLRDGERWRVTSGKPDGDNPGFLAKSEDGRRYLLKFDSRGHPRATAADVIVSRLYHAVGFQVPCNRIVLIDPGAVAIDPLATYTTATGDKVPFSRELLEPMFSHAARAPNGMLRASASKLLDGEPLGPFRYEGTRSDDVNDVVPHEERRELRGHRLLAAWVGHTDTREANTLDTWVSDSRARGHVEHHLLDFGDALGCVWEPPMLGRRIGHSTYFDVTDVLVDWLSLGTVDRPWEHARFGPEGPALGYYNVAQFDPASWTPGYGNPAMSRMTERDGAWMARILARLTRRHVAAVVVEARLGNTPLASTLLETLEGRRRRILSRYLAPGSRFGWPTLRPVDDARRPGWSSLCVDDLVAASEAFVPAATAGRLTLALLEGDADVALDPQSNRFGSVTCVGARMTCRAARGTCTRNVEWRARGPVPGLLRVRIEVRPSGPSRIVRLERATPPAAWLETSTVSGEK